MFLLEFSGPATRECRCRPFLENLAVVLNQASEQKKFSGSNWKIYLEH